MGLFSFIKSKFLNTQDKPLEPLADGKQLPQNENEFKEWHYRALRRLNKHPVNEPFTGKLSIEVDMPSFINIALENELIVVASYNEALHMLKNDNLKSILKENSLPVSGNKAELIDRIKSSLDRDTVKSSSFYSDYYLTTPKAQQIIQDSYSTLDEEHLSFSNTAYNLIVNYRFNDAYRMICKKQAESPFPAGLGCDWTGWYKRGLDQDKLNYYHNRLLCSTQKAVTAAAIYANMSPESFRNIEHELSSTVPLLSENNNMDKVHFEWLSISSDFHIFSYRKAKIKEYRFCATFDNNTCPICGQLDGKIFKLDDAQIGTNFPPVHPRCRCTTTAVIDREWDLKGKRSARDSSGRSIEVPASMTYSEWSAKYGNRDFNT